ncbi:hypothetical protein CVT24_008834 [Panaeolus cyanescens]|uniref:Uncharacterized protein n=1 Tax=Panaeolus cyanescens TaxID=181874 RepID=A0A409VK83_9AGAR|nr:hypothetical protein CVT24_008834 [Panaeolus cyanescens]
MSQLPAGQVSIAVLYDRTQRVFIKNVIAVSSSTKFGDEIKRDETMAFFSSNYDNHPGQSLLARKVTRCTWTEAKTRELVLVGLVHVGTIQRTLSEAGLVDGKVQEVDIDATGLDIEDINIFKSGGASIRTRENIVKMLEKNWALNKALELVTKPSTSSCITKPNHHQPSAGGVMSMAERKRKSIEKRVDDKIEHFEFIAGVQALARSGNLTVEAMGGVGFYSLVGDVL